MKSRTILLNFFLIIFSSLLFIDSAVADKPLKSALGLDTDQAAKVAAIQKQARDAMRKPRGELHKKQRELRRAKAASDSATLIKLESEIVPLQDKMRQIHSEEEKNIRAVITPEQTTKYEEWLEQRDKMAGSSRDVKDYK